MPKPSANHAVLLGWDAADWTIINPLLDAGLMPNLRKLVDRGVMGSLETLQPPLSPMLWTSIATGKTADQHGILGFLEPDPVGGRVRPVTSSSRQTKALWNMLDERGLRSLVVNWFASHPAEPISGAIVSNAYCKVAGAYHTEWPVVPRSIHPATMEETLAGLRVHPGELTGDDLAPFLPKLDEIDQKTDKRPFELASIMAEMVTLQAATTWLMENEPWNFVAVYFDAIDHAGHHFMRYRAPRMSEIPERDFEIYKDVIDGVYCFHDLMLGRIVDLAGPEATVIVLSDHGFQSGRYRPNVAANAKDDSPLSWHRSHGILCVAGPGIRRDELIYGAGLLDIAPTVLAMFGLPRGADMPGRVLAEVFEEPVSMDTIPTWEGASSPLRSTAGEESWAAAAVLAQLSDLGYIDSIGEDARDALRKLENDRNFNLAKVHLACGRPHDAIPLLEELAANADAEHGVQYRMYLAQALSLAGRLDECRAIVDAVLAAEPAQTAALVIRGNLAFVEGDPGGGLEYLLKAEADWQDSPQLKHLIGRVYLRAGNWEEAARCFRAVIAFDPDFAESHAALARCLMETRRWKDAAAEALEAVGLKFNQPGSHYVLGVSLAKLGETERAAQAFETCLKLAPDTKGALEWLARLQVAR